MQTMKRLLAFALALTMAFALAQTPLILKHEIKPAKTEE